MMKKMIIVVLVVVLAIFTVGIIARDKKNTDEMDSGQSSPVLEEVLESTEECRMITNDVEKEPDEQAWCEANWSFDVRDPKEVYSKNDYFVKIKPEAREKAHFYDKSDPMPTTMYYAHVLEVVKGKDIPKHINISLIGGQVTYNEYMNTLDSADKKKQRYDTLSNEDLRKEILFLDDAYYKLELGKEYYVSIEKPEENGEYAFMVAGYAVFEERDGKLYNVITGRELVL